MTGRAATLALLFAASACAQVAVTGKVTDENGVALPGVRIELRTEGAAARPAVSGASGQFTFSLERAGDYRVRAEREGFFRLADTAVTLREGENQLALTLNHLQEFAESVDVVYSPPAIALDEPSDHRELNTVEVLTVPYPAPHDLRNALPLFNGVVQDTAGRAHVNGGATEQTSYSLDGFNIADPVTGRLEARMNIDTVRSLDLETSRFAADKGRGSAGSLDIQTKMGDDRWRFGGTNFIPGVSTDGGLHVNKWTPRVEISGPIAHSRAWFHNGFDAFYDVDTIHGLPHGQNRTNGLTANDLTRFQVNLSPSNILTGSFLLNYMDRTRNGLSFLDPAETTTNWHQNLFMSTVRDQMYFSGGMLLDFGFADSRGSFRQIPQGTEVYQITPFGNRGNYFAGQDRHIYRQQGLANAVFPSLRAFGSHQFKAGIDIQREAFHQQVTRHDYEVLRTDSSVARQVTFAGDPFQQLRNFETAVYWLDRWTPREGVSVEAGMRSEWNQIVKQVLWSPRISVAWAPGWLRDTKLAAGYGVFYDALPLGILTRQQDQVAYSTYFPPGGLPPATPVPTRFFVNGHDLEMPRYRTASLSLERKLPFELFGRASWTRKVGRQGFTFVPASAGPGSFNLHNWRNDRYDAGEFSVRRTFRHFEWSAGYVRSSARTDAAVDYSLENPVFGLQAPGAFPWDTTNRFLTWGWAPVPQGLLPEWLRFAVRETDVAYLAEYHTGFPFSVVNEEGWMVGPPSSHRYPAYFNVNLHLERKFRALHYLWAWRFGFNNLTNNGNPNVVNNNVDSPTYLAYGRGQARAFSVRLRLLGKK